MKDLVAYIARGLVDLPDAVSVDERVAEGATVVSLRVDPADLGKVIGKQGRTARAIRQVLLAAAMKSRRRVVLEIVDAGPVGSAHHDPDDEPVEGSGD